MNGWHGRDGEIAIEVGTCLTPDAGAAAQYAVLNGTRKGSTLHGVTVDTAALIVERVDADVHDIDAGRLPEGVDIAIIRDSVPGRADIQVDAWIVCTEAAVAATTVTARHQLSGWAAVNGETAEVVSYHATEDAAEAACDDERMDYPLEAWDAVMEQVGA